MEAAAPDRLEVSFRPATEGDIAFVMRSFVESWSGSEQALEARRELGLSRPGILDAAHAMMTGLLARGYGVTVAADPSDADTIYGFVVHRGNVCAYLYVRATARRLRVGTRLMEHAGFSVRRPFTVVFAKIATLAEARKRGWTMRLNPFLAMVTS